MEETIPKPATREEVDEHLHKMNVAWRLYHYMELEQPFAPKAASDAVAAQFTAACFWLETYGGIKWFSLPYDSETKTYSLPEQGELCNDEC